MKQLAQLIYQDMAPAYGVTEPGAIAYACALARAQVPQVEKSGWESIPASIKTPSPAPFPAQRKKAAPGRRPWEPWAAMPKKVWPLWKICRRASMHRPRPFWKKEPLQWKCAAWPRRSSSKPG